MIPCPRTLAAASWRSFGGALPLARLASCLAASRSEITWPVAGAAELRPAPLRLAPAVVTRETALARLGLVDAEGLGDPGRPHARLQPLAGERFVCLVVPALLAPDEVLVELGSLRLGLGAA